MGSPIFDATFGTGRFRYEEPKPGPDADRASPEPRDVREALADLVKWKDYKDEHGADATYELGKERAWRNARAALAQSDAAPVAWQYRIKQGGWGGWHEAAPTKAEALSCIEAQQRLGLVDEYELRPLYTAPPRPDASKGISISDETLTIEWVIDEKKFGPKLVKVERPDVSGLIEALERISKSDVYDMDTLHPDRCASVAAEALKAFRAADRSGT